METAASSGMLYDLIAGGKILVRSRGVEMSNSERPRVQHSYQVSSGCKALSFVSI